LIAAMRLLGLRLGSQPRVLALLCMKISARQLLISTVALLECP